MTPRFELREVLERKRRVRGRVAVALWIVGAALCAWQVAQARFVADLSSFLPGSPTPEQRLLVDQLRDGAPSRVMLIGIEGGDAAARADASRALARTLAANPLFASVANGADAGFGRERELLLAHRYALSPNVSARRFSVEGLRDALAETVDLLASPAGLLAKSLVPRDPTGEMLAVAERLRPAESPGRVQGAWASADGRRALLIARTRAPGSDTDAQARALAAVQQTFRESTAQARGLELLVSGPGVLAVRARAMIVRDVERLAAVSVLLVAALLLAVYRSPLALALGLVPVASGALAGIAAVSLGFDAVHGITLGFGTTLIGEAVDYSIYLFVQSERGEAAGGEQWIEGFWPTIRIGVLTSIAGFSALVFSGLPGLAQLGVYSIAGLVAAAAVTRFVLPALLPADFHIRDLSASGERLAALAARLPAGRWIAAAAALAAAALLAAHGDTLWDRQLSSLNPISAHDRDLDAQLRSALGASDARLMVVARAGSMDAALASAERVGAQLDALVAAGKLADFESPARFLPSEATQRARLASLPPAGELRTRLKTALAQSPLRADKLEPFLADVERERAAGPLTREALRGTGLEAALDGLLFQDASGAWNALIGLRAAPQRPIDAQAVRAAIAASGVKGAALLDVKGEVDRMYAGYFERALLASGIGLAAIVVLLLASLRSPARVARVMVPLAAGVMVVAAAHVLAGTRLSLLHLVGLLLVVAIGSNYTLFFERTAGRRDAAAARTLASLALANATTVASFGVLALSAIPVLNAIGSTVAAGAFLTLAFALQFAQGKTQHADDPPYRGPA